MSVARNWRSFPVTVDHGAGSARGRRSAAFLLSWVLLGAVGGQAFASAQGTTPTAGDLKHLSIEDLMNLDVTSVAKEPQRLLQAAAGATPAPDVYLRAYGKPPPDPAEALVE